METLHKVQTIESKPSKPELQAHKLPIGLSPKLCSLILMYANLLQSCAALEYKPYGNTPAPKLENQYFTQQLPELNQLNELARLRLPKHSFPVAPDLPSQSLANPSSQSMLSLFLFTTDPILNGVSDFNLQNTDWTLNYELLLNTNQEQPSFKQFQPKATAF